MGYTNDFHQLTKLYRTDQDTLTLKDWGIKIKNPAFHSRYAEIIPAKCEAACSSDKEFFLQPDQKIPENRNFTYPVIKNNHNSDESKVIILLHGLNERSWHKYLPWGKELCLKTGHPVILFPIAFHINRAPARWSEPRSMMPLVKHRKKKHPDLRESTFVNAAISQRFEEQPQRFFLSGLESYFDLYDLIRQLQAGEHPHISRRPEINFFAYSIGAFLTEIMLMSNPEKRVSRSRAFLFCGGPTFDKMYGTSRCILDSKAAESVKDFYLNPNFTIALPDSVEEEIQKLDLRKIFHAMVDSSIYREYRHACFSSLADSLRLYPLRKDHVVPAESVKETFSRVCGEIKDIVNPQDFPFEYSHENPFPQEGDHEQIDRAFSRIFADAAAFLE
ncbi:MAG: DUF6051 family protein [Bacteroidales bacterium]|nr:DUF6051 family protein [Bacteroidales bacterium]MCF8337284.1 DUF6051 family protein [Bacteroidales bacterium]